jgi:two-component system chemotaxis sensor kinase CheA
MDDVLRQVVGVFAEEVKEHAHKIASAILAMEADPTTIRQHIEELYRQAHSLKGSSSSLGLTELETLAHNLEEALMGVRRGRAPLTPELCDLALRAMDAARLRADGLIIADRELGLREAQDLADELLRATAMAPAPMADAAPSERAGATEESAPTPAPAVSDDNSETLRVAAARLQLLERRLDDLRNTRGRLDRHAQTMAQIGQSVEGLWLRSRTDGAQAISSNELYQLLRQLSALRRELADDAGQTQGNLLEMEDNLMAMRMVPAALLREPLQRATREACRRSGKEATFELVGGTVQLDRRLLEALKNPLLHLVRNGVDHGIEAVDVREAIGKPSRATVRVSIEQRGREVLITVEDDGRGIDFLSVRANAVERGLIDEARAAELGAAELKDLLFLPGFSTAVEVTELSGRGVGLDVVRDALLRLQGRITVETETGRGTTFQMVVPLTVAASESMILEESGRPYALPLSAIERIVRVVPSELRATGRRVIYHVDDQPVLVVQLARVLGLKEHHEGGSHRTLAIVRGNGERAALECERLLGSQDLVLRSLPRELQTLPLLSAAALLSDGRPVLVLSPHELVRAASALPSSNARAEGHRTRPGTVLIADDSITTRSLLRSALEASGYCVRVAADGDEALKLALTEPFDLVVSDVRMPRLDGFSLTTQLRANPTTTRVPVVLFSSLDSDEDRQRGLASGASAYLSKRAFDRGQLLDTIVGLIRET